MLTLDNFFAINGDLKIRHMEDKDSDYSLMTKWLSNPFLLEFYEGRDKVFTLDTVKEKYQPRVLNKDNVIPCIVSLKEDPLGYVQYYELTDNQKVKYGLDKNKKSFGVDLFIGEVEYWSKGLGTQLLNLVVSYLFTKENAYFVTIDPKTNNERAIRSYEKVGFEKKKVLKNHELHEEKYYDNWLMIISKDKYKNLGSNPSTSYNSEFIELLRAIAGENLALKGKNGIFQKPFRS